jgi:hypothetical protein
MLVALTLVAEAVTSHIRKPAQGPNTRDFWNDLSVVVLLSDPSATEGGGHWRRRRRDI